MPPLRRLRLPHRQPHPPPPPLDHHHRDPLTPHHLQLAGLVPAMTEVALPRRRLNYAALTFSTFTRLSIKSTVARSFPAPPSSTSLYVSDPSCNTSSRE